VYGSATGLLANVLTISGTTIIVGAQQSLATEISGINAVSAVSLSATEAIVAYSNSSGNGQLLLAALDISGDTVTKGSNATLSSANADGAMSGAALDSSHTIFVFSDNSENAQAIAAQKSGATVTIGAKTAIFTDADAGSRGYEPSVSKISDGVVLATSAAKQTFINGAISQILRVSGTVIDVTNPQLFQIGAGQHGGGSTQSLALSTTQAILTDPVGTSGEIYSLRIA